MTTAAEPLSPTPPKPSRTRRLLAATVGLAALAVLAWRLWPVLFGPPSLSVSTLGAGGFRAEVARVGGHFDVRREGGGGYFTRLSPADSYTLALVRLPPGQDAVGAGGLPRDFAVGRFDDGTPAVTLRAGDTLSSPDLPAGTRAFDGFYAWRLLVRPRAARSLAVAIVPADPTPQELTDAFPADASSVTQSHLGDLLAVVLAGERDDIARRARAVLPTLLAFARGELRLVGLWQSNDFGSRDLGLRDVGYNERGLDSMRLRAAWAASLADSSRSDVVAVSRITTGFAAEEALSLAQRTRHLPAGGGRAIATQLRAAYENWPDDLRAVQVLRLRLPPDMTAEPKYADEVAEIETLLQELARPRNGR